MAWWKCNQPVEDHGEDALAMERGVPEGSDDPPALFGNYKTWTILEQKKLIVMILAKLDKNFLEFSVESDKSGVEDKNLAPAKWKATPKMSRAIKKKPVGRGHLLPIYPGPCAIAEDLEDDDFVIVDVPLMIQVSGTQLALERLLDTTVYKVGAQGVLADLSEQKQLV